MTKQLQKIGFSTFHAKDGFGSFALKPHAKINDWFK